jgi:hypothetical protein
MTVCKICRNEGQDHRTLCLKNLYDLSEISDNLIFDEETKLFRIPSCKRCRGDFMRLLGEWCRGEHITNEDHDAYCGDSKAVINPEATIPVRIDGVLKMLTPEEFDEWRRDDD